MTFATTVARKSGWLALAALALAGLAMLLFGPERSAAQTPQVSLQLSAANEVPPITDANVGGQFMANVVGESVDADLSAVGETFTQAHFHVGKAGANGPVVAFLFGPSEEGSDAIHPTLIVRPENLVGPMKGDWKAFTTAWNAGEIYVNVHSKTHPAGVLRAQVPARPAAPGAPNTGSGIADGGGTWFNASAFGAILVGLAAGAGVLGLLRRRA